MDLLKSLSSKEEWENFYSYKLLQGNSTDKQLNALRRFIDENGYVPLVENIANKKPFSYPTKKLINKTKAGKKRAVYTFTEEENYILKMITFLLKEYDGIFSDNLYSFRKDSGVKKAVDKILHIRALPNYYVYKVDISNYFNSIDVDILLGMLKNVLTENDVLYEFIRDILKCPYAVYEGEVIKENKGVMAGSPISGFLANLYLSDLDKYFYSKKILYMRYSDDIIVFSKNIDELNEYIAYIKNVLSERKLCINEEKEYIKYPNEKWDFLGFSYQNKVIDISEVSFKKLKAKMRRKCRGLHRWASKKNIDGIYAAKSFIKQFNSKFYDNPIHNELTWSRWFFPVINTDVTLKKIEDYFKECIRYLATGKRTKSRFDFRYDEMKLLGYKSLVAEYYKAKKQQNH